MSLTRTLLVDDDDVVIALLRFALGKPDFKLQATNNAHEALSLFDSQHFDVLFTDLRLGPMSGLQLAQAARNRWPNIAIVLMTAAESEHFAEAVHDGLIDYVLAKPFSLADVENVIGRFREKKQPTNEL
jgi:DNA-binding NtrC family response regulator